MSDFRRLQIERDEARGELAALKILRDVDRAEVEKLRRELERLRIQGEADRIELEVLRRDGEMPGALCTCEACAVVP